eukprot:CAMPEP_0177794466 /NCGR_PEP_ID=MMETSP0491_2-20121128/25668_1 /TAXON_ID=63592 /ORGANISM="Tetraselmis chuii, Strain PLY429" /LENGTH=368 /DNA_ID=CAMNT_0019317139 /DNA_START=58 /DNA_END=1166 /DNA_ORIENTATION=-
MNSLEAYRVMQVLDEAMDGLRLLSHVDSEVLEAADTLGDVVGEDISKSLLTHKIAAAGCRGQVSHDTFNASSMELWRILKKSPTAESKLSAMQKERSPAMMSYLQTFEKLRQTAYKKLTTTVEEDNSNREHFMEVCMREKKALEQRNTLEQQLASATGAEKEMEQITNAEDRAASELEDIQEEAKMRQGSLDETSRRAKESDLEKFNSENGKLGKEREKLMGELAELRARNKEMETQARKKKSKGEQEVEAWLNDYDRDMGSKESAYRDEDMGSKESAYRDELAVYERVVAQLEEYQEKTTQLKAEREEYERQERLRMIAELTERNREKIRNKAALTIQTAWKAYWANKLAEIKKAKKKAKKDKGKKK